MNKKQINEYFLYIEMILATPGAKLHQGFHRLRKKHEFATAILLGITLILAGTILWQFRGNDTGLLMLAGIGLITVFSLLFSWIWRHKDTILGIGEALTYPFYNSYEQCRKALDQIKTTAYTNMNATGPEQSGQSDTTDSQKQSADTKSTKDQQTQNRCDNNEYQHEQERRRSTSEDRYHRERHVSSGNARLEEAKAFFGVDIPFTADEIKQRRNQLLKKYHPDNPDGSEEMCKKINECYALLIRYAA